VSRPKTLSKKHASRYPTEKAGSFLGRRGLCKQVRHKAKIPAQNQQNKHAIICKIGRSWPVEELLP
jgi:hypothetical protein